MPKVSILVPVFNGAAHIERALASIQEQTFRDFEIIVVDDGSTDTTAEVVAAFHGVRLIRQENQGIGATRQRLLEEAAGDWCAFCDHDDHWMPSKLESQLGAADEGTVLIHTHHTFHWPSGHREIKRWSPPRGAHALDHLLTDCRINTSSVLLRRAALLAAGGFPTDLRQAEDFAAWFRLAAKGEFRVVTEMLTWSLEREGSASTPGIPWFDAERTVLERELLGELDGRFASLPPTARAHYRRLALRKVAILASLKAAALDAAGRAPAA